MRWLRGLLLAVSFGPLASACSSGTPETSGSEAGSGSLVQAITAACSNDTVGLPCDPDGPAGAKLECEGRCAVAASGLVVCQGVAAGTLNGVICGTTNAVGDNACKRYCSGRTCLAADAPAGAACRPTSKSNVCEGQCNGAGKCENLGASACDFGRDGQLCTFATCNLANASACLIKNLVRPTLCSDADACSIGTCDNSGKCVAGPTKGCDDGNPCTDDSCDPQDGGCTGINNDANVCSDGNACTTGDYCSAGGCVSGTTPTDCNDDNACTADSCDPNTGCAHIAKSCSDNDACTDDVCDPLTAGCSHPAKVCNDNDACTTDGCNAGSGCTFTAINCDDADACTADSCAAGACKHDVVNCDDNDPCTADSCESVGGCAHAPVVGCDGGAGGAGGEGPQGTAGEPGAAGEGAVGGSATGEAGTATGGTAGSGTGGTAGTAGTEASSGTAGSQTTAGNGTAGNATGGNAAGSGAAATAGSPGDAGMAAVEPGQTSDTSSGCGCRAAGGTVEPSTWGWSLALLGLTVLRRRRRA